MSDMPVWEAIHTQRAIRRFTSAPVEDGLLERIVEAATRAPSARNSQPWRFIVVRERGRKARLGEIFDELGREMYGDAAADHTPWADVPALIAVCSIGAAGDDGTPTLAIDASIFPAVQNLLLAARALGLGTVLTTRWKRRGSDVRAVLDLPADAAVRAIVPTGWPASTFGATRRRSPADVMFREVLGRPW